MDHHKHDDYLIYEALNKSVQDLIIVNQKIARQQNFMNTFLRGLFSAIGQTLGIAVVVSILIYILKLVGIFNYFAPYLNSFKS